MTPEERVTVPSFDRTYKSVNGDPIAGDFGWVTDLEYFEDDDEPVQLIEETWQRTGVRTFWHLPALYSCEIDIDCDEDADAWVLVDDEPRAACTHHASNATVLERR